MPATAQEADDPEERVDGLLAELAEPGRADWMSIEQEVLRLWSRSGSPSMDLLLRRGREAIEAEDYGAAVEHLTALTDHAPEFAEGWNARATAFYSMGEFALSIADVRRVLALNPNHFGAIAGLGYMFEDLGDDRAALEVFSAAHEIHPHREDINNAIKRIQMKLGSAEL